MKHIQYTTKNICSKTIEFDLTDDFKIFNLNFVGGCNGNLKAISKLIDGQDARKIKELLNGNTCGMRDTSCTDQLAKAIEEALELNY